MFFANHASAPASIFFVVSVKPPLIALDEGDRVIGYFLLPFFGLQPTEIMKTTLPVEGDFLLLFSKENAQICVLSGADFIAICRCYLPHVRKGKELICSGAKNPDSERWTHRICF